MTPTGWLPACPPPLPRSERFQMLFIGLVAFGLFGALRSPDFNDYDGVQFALAVRDGYDLNLHTPHPPGFPLYILAANGLDFITHNAFEALTWLSAMGGALSLAMIWWVARLWWPARPAVAWLATGWLLFTPHFWLGAEKELSDVPTLALHLAVIGCGWRGLWSWKWRTLATALVAVGLGFRVQNGAAFLPPWLLFTMLSLWTDPGQKGVSRMARTAWTLATQFTVLGGICALWFGGMLYLAGGWSPLEQAVEYHTAFLFQSENTMGISGGFHLGWWATRVALHANSFLLAAFGVALRLITRSNALILWGPGLAAVIVVGLALWRARSPQAIAALLWALPHFILEVLVFQPSNVRYALPLLPPVILFASAGVALWRIPRPVKLLIVAPLAIWLVFISSWCIRTLRTVRSPLVASVDWVFDGDHGSPGWGSGRVNVRGEVHRLAEYRYPLRHFDYIYERAAGAAGRVDVVVVAPPESDWFYTDSLSVDAGEFERSFIVHPKHSHLRAEIYDIHRPRPGS